MRIYRFEESGREGRGGEGRLGERSTTIWFRKVFTYEYGSKKFLAQRKYQYVCDVAIEMENCTSEKKVLSIDTQYD